MDGGEDIDEGSEKAESFFGWTTVLLFTLLVIATVIRAIVGWRQNPWVVLWDTIGGAFGVSLLLYLGAGGSEAVIGKRASDRRRRLTLTERVGRAGLALLSLTLFGNLAAAVWEPLPVALNIARSVAGGAFALCVICYLIVRFTQHLQTKRSLADYPAGSLLDEEADS